MDKIEGESTEERIWRFRELLAEILPLSEDDLRLVRRASDLAREGVTREEWEIGMRVASIPRNVEGFMSLLDDSEKTE